MFHQNKKVAVILNVIIVRRIMGIPGGNHADIAIDAVVVSPTVAMILLLHLYTSLNISTLERVYEQFLLESCDYFPHKGYLVMRTQQLIIVSYPVDSKWEAMQCLDFEIELAYCRSSFAEAKAVPLMQDELLEAECNIKCKAQGQWQYVYHTAEEIMYHAGPSHFGLINMIKDKQYVVVSYHIYNNSKTIYITFQFLIHPFLILCGWAMIIYYSL